MRGFVWFGLGVLLLLAWGISYIVFQVTGVLIHLLLICALNIIHDLRVHRKTRSRIMVGFALSDILF